MSVALSLSTIPRMRGLPLLSNLLDARHNFLKFLLRLSRECGSIGTRTDGGSPCILRPASKYDLLMSDL
jgi:hypothetical protein